MPTDRPMPLLERQRIIGAQCMVSRVTLRRGCVVPVHAHANEQVACVVSGRLRFILPASATGDVEVGAGGALYLPAHAPHGAEAVEDSVVLDIFAPPSEKTGIDRP